jgi:hypothetical protein
MADARHSALFANEHKRGFKLLFLKQDDDFGDGYITLSLQVPHPRALRRIVVRRFFLLRNHLLRSLWPASPMTCIMVICLVVAIVVRADESSWLRRGWLAKLLWWFDEFSPLRDVWRKEWRVGGWAAWTAFFGFIVAMYIQRFILRLLLYYRGWM